MPRSHFLLLLNFGAPQFHATYFAYKPPPAPTPNFHPSPTSAWCGPTHPHAPRQTLLCVPALDCRLGTQPHHWGQHCTPTLVSTLGLPSSTCPSLLPAHSCAYQERTHHPPWGKQCSAPLPSPPRGGFFLSGGPRSLLAGEPALWEPSPARLLLGSPKATLWEPLCGHYLPPVQALA